MERKSVQTKWLDFTKKRIGSITDEGSEIDYCPSCGRKGEHHPEGINPAGTKAFRGFYIHQAILDQTNNTVTIMDSCEIPWSSEALEIIKSRSALVRRGELEDIYL